MKCGTNTEQKHINASQRELFLDYLGSICDLYINFIIDLPQKIEIQKLHDAMSLVAKQEPIISARYVRGGNRPYWVLEKKPDWDIKEIGPDVETPAYAHELIAKPPHPEGNLPISIRVIHLPKGTRLHIRISHILADGGGSKEFIYILASAYKDILNKVEKESDYVVLETRHFTGFKECFKKFHFFHLISGFVLDKISLLLPDNYFSIPMKIIEETEGRIVSLHINRARVIKLKKCAKANSATLNDLLLVALSRALYNCFISSANIGKQFGIVITSDMRRFIDGERNLCNLSNWIILKLGIVPLPTQVELIKKVVCLTNRWKKNLNGLGNFLFNIAFLKCQSERSIRFIVNKFIKSALQAKKCRIGFSNSGLLNSKKIDFGDGPCTNAFILPPIGKPPVLFAGASGCDDKICLSIGYKESSLSKATLNKLVREIDQELSLLEQMEY